MNAQLTAAIAKVKEKGEAMGVALTLEQELEDDRAAIKADAINRVMERDGVAATRAEKVVETDHEYFHHRAKQRMSIVARFKADAEYWAAKVEATQASLITPDVLALEAEISELREAIDEITSLARDLKAENKSLAADRVALVAANDRLTREINNSLVGRA